MPDTDTIRSSTPVRHGRAVEEIARDEPSHIHIPRPSRSMRLSGSRARTAEQAAQVPVGRAGTPEDIASVIVFLASDRAGYITGASLDANGGIFMA